MTPRYKSVGAATHANFVLVVRPHNGRGARSAPKRHWLDPGNAASKDAAYEKPNARLFALRVEGDGSNPGALAGRIAGYGDNRCPFRHALNDLDAIAIIPPDRDLLKVDDPIRLNNGELGAIRSEDDRRGRHHERRIGARGTQVDLRVRSREQRSVRVRHVYLDEHRTGGWIERIRGTHHRALK